MNKAVFLDRDGIINVEKRYLYKIEDFEFVDGIFETLLFFQDLGYILIIITNQSGIARGYYSEADFFVLTGWMLREFEKAGVHIAKVYFSPYHPECGIGEYKRESFCRKPNPGMILQAKREFNIDLQHSILIGDQETDIEAGINAGVGTNILVRSKTPFEKIESKAGSSLRVVKHIKEIIAQYTV